MKCTAVTENTAAHECPDTSRMSPVSRVLSNPASVAKVFPRPKIDPACRGAMSSWLTLTAPSVSAFNPSATVISIDAEAAELPVSGAETASRHSAGPSMPITYTQSPVSYIQASWGPSLQQNDAASSDSHAAHARQVHVAGDPKAGPHARVAEAAVMMEQHLKIAAHCLHRVALLDEAVSQYTTYAACNTSSHRLGMLGPPLAHNSNGATQQRTVAAHSDSVPVMTCARGGSTVYSPS